MCEISDSVALGSRICNNLGYMRSFSVASEKVYRYNFSIHTTVDHFFSSDPKHLQGGLIS